MSGHSKWANIKQRKSEQDKKRGAVFTKMIRGIVVAAQKGSDVDSNVTLKIAVDSAKRAGVPKDTIDRAIKRGSGEDKDAARMEETLYEGFGPCKVAVLVETITDSKNRASADIKHVFTKYGGSFGGAGSVQWMFEKKSVFELSAEQIAEISDLDELQLELMDAGAADIDDSNGLSVTAMPEAFGAIMNVFKKRVLEPELSAIIWDAKDSIKVDESAKQQIDAFLDKLYELDDVSEVYTNCI